MYGSLSLILPLNLYTKLVFKHPEYYNLQKLFWYFSIVFSIGTFALCELYQTPWVFACFNFLLMCQYLNPFPFIAQYII